MKPIAKLAVTCALSLFSGLQVAAAAVTCVESKATGKFVERTGNHRATGQCEAQSVMNMVSTVQEVEDLSATEGTKVIGGVIVTNAAKPFSTTPPKAEKIVEEESAAASAEVPRKASEAKDRISVASATAQSPDAPLAATVKSSAPSAVATVPASPKPFTAVGASTSFPVPAPLAADTKPAQTWAITLADKSVRELFERWSKASGYQLIWDVPKDLELNAYGSAKGTFEEALFEVLASLQNSEYPIEAVFYDDNRAVRIVKHTRKDK